MTSNPGDRRRDELGLWPFWERTCPRCGRYHRRFRNRSEGWTCSFCGWTGTLPVTSPLEDAK